MKMPETMERSQDQQTRALAPSAPRDVEIRSGMDLDDVPIYASTGVKHIKMGSSGKYWIEIQEELDFGQQTILDNASVIGVQREQGASVEDANQTVRLDLTRQRFLLCATWLVRWNVPPDQDGKPIRLPRHINDRITTMKRLHPLWGDAIVEKITEHVAAKQELQQKVQEEADADAAIDAESEEVNPNDIPPTETRLNGSSGTDDTWNGGE
jgi:hypothetical protein